MNEGETNMNRDQNTMHSDEDIVNRGGNTINEVETYCE